MSAVVLYSVIGQASVTAGNWYLQASSQVSADASQIPQIGGSLTQTDSVISGVLHVSNSSCFDGATAIPVSGTVSGDTVTLTSDSIIGQVITITGSATSNLMTGTYSIASGCAGGDHGTITAVLIPPVTGNWTGTFTDDSTGKAATASFSQDAPNPDGYSPLSGTLNLSGSQCSISGTLATEQSWVLGNLVQANVNMSDGSILALTGFITDASTTAKQMTVNFSISGGKCSGQGGSVTFNRI
jgi:hypothetical protein